MYRMASGAWLSGYVLSMTGVTWPDSMSWASTSRSAAFSETMTAASRCGTNRETTGARRLRSNPPSQRPVTGKGGAKLPERAVPADVDDHVVALCSVGDAGARVVDHVVRADGPDQVHLRGAAHAGDFGTVGLGDLHGERPDAARCADDQDLLPGVHVPVVADSLQGGQG